MSPLASEAFRVSLIGMEFRFIETKLHNLNFEVVILFFFLFFFIMANLAIRNTLLEFYNCS